MGANRFISFVMPLSFVAVNAVANYTLDATLGRVRRAGRGQARTAAWLIAVTALCWLSFNGLWGDDRSGDRWRNMIVSTPPLQLDDHVAMSAARLRCRDSCGPGRS